jgi:hypothetical protein
MVGTSGSFLGKLLVVERSEGRFWLNCAAKIAKNGIASQKKESLVG